MQKLFTSESVTSGHPDKLADQISDLVLDAHLEIDPNSKVACEVAITPNRVLVFGEITSNASVDVESIVRNKIREVGYTKDFSKFNDEDVEVVLDIGMQSPDIALGVLKEDQGAGDQGIVFGFAANETKNFMPLSIELAHKLAKRLEVVRKEGIIKGLRPDGKTQVTVEYCKEDLNIVKRIHTVVLSTQHSSFWNDKQDLLKLEVIKHVIKPILPINLVDENLIYHINETGKFEIGGPEGDSGLTGRKLIVDSYGGYSRHGGGAFSGKDASKVDRSGAYMARYIAKNVVAAGLADKFEIQIGYAIGKSKPVSVFIETFGTNKVDDEVILNAVLTTFDLRPKEIIKTLNLTAPIYKNTSVYGHFGKSDNLFPWEKTDKIAILNKVR